MDTINGLLNQFNGLPDNQKLALVGGAVILLIVIIIIIARVSRFEAFEPLNEMMDNYASYPSIFSQKIVGPEGKEIKFDNYFVKPDNEVKPLEPPMEQQKASEPVKPSPTTPSTPAPMEKATNQAPAPTVSQKVPEQKLEVPKMETKVPIDIGNGVAVNATIKVPAQTVQVPAQTATTEITPPAPTNIEVGAQTVQLPAQTGVLPAVIDGKNVTVPVQVPAQAVAIPAQNAIIPKIEPFRL